MQFLHQMFNVSTLLLDDALKPATTLTIDQWRDQWNAATVCPTQWRSPALAGWLYIQIGWRRKMSLRQLVASVL